MTTPSVVYIAITKQNLGALRYLNEAVVSLAITDLLTGIIGFPPTILYYYWGEKTDLVFKKSFLMLKFHWMI